MVDVREAALQDMEFLVDFQVNLAKETENIDLDRVTVIRGIKALLSDRSKGVYYLALVDHQPVGCHLITYEWSEWRNGTVWWLQSVYVDKSYRSQGVFKAMFENIKRIIHNDSSIFGLRLYVDKTNDHAQQVYRSLNMNGEHYTVFEWMK